MKIRDLDHLKQVFDDQNDEFLKFERITEERRRHRRPDLCAFLLLDAIAGEEYEPFDMVSAAEHEEIWLEIEPRMLVDCATEEDVIDLIRCGVRYDRSIDSLCMFV